jgi:hypothetical protein
MVNYISDITGQKTFAETKKTNYLRSPNAVIINARVAELVDALVSNTSGSDTVPVRSRPRVQAKTLIPEYGLGFTFIQ